MAKVGVNLMISEERKPAEVFPLAQHLAEEMEARGWTTEDVAFRMGGTANEIAYNILVVDLIMCIHKDKLVLTDENFNDLARAFDVSPEFFRNLDAQWRKWPDRRVEFVPDEKLFGPISRRSTFRAA